MSSKNIFSLKSLLVITLILALLQSTLVEYTTTDYAHNIFSLYFFIEILILIALVFGYNKKWFPIFLLITLVAESITFLLNDLPFSTDNSLMALIFVIRLYVGYKLVKRN